MSKDEKAGKKDDASKTRRKVLTGGGVIGASVLGTKWAKPAVDSVVLPAHATGTTPAPTSAPTEDSGTQPPT